MTLVPQMHDVVKYEVPMFPYNVSVTVKVDRHGYEKLRHALSRNVEKALMLFDTARAHVFANDWMCAIDSFEKAGAIDAALANSERDEVRKSPVRALKQGASLVKHGLGQISSWDRSSKLLAAAAAFVGSLALMYWNSRRKTARKQS